MDLPTFIVILFMIKGTVYTHAEQAPSHEACLQSLSSVPAILASTIKEPVQMQAAVCMKMKPVYRDA